MTSSLNLGGLEHGFEQETPEEKVKRHVADHNAREGHLNLEDGYDCPICKNKGDIACEGGLDYFGHPYYYHKDCKCKVIRNAIRKLNQSGLKDAVKRYTFEKYQTPEPWQVRVKQTAMRFCEDAEHTWFFIAGNSGSGKSHICTAIAVHYIRQGIDTHYMLWRDEIVQLKASITEPEVYAKKMKKLKEVPVLYIDDFFKNGKGADGKAVPPTAADVNAAFEIINHRYNTPQLTTIISSERTLAELMDIDEATASRIVERSKEGGYCLNMKKDSSRNWRLRGLEEI